MVIGATASAKAGDITPFQASDGLKLAARVWKGPTGRSPVVLCLHGLTRNSRDFAPLAHDLSRKFTVVAPDQRGRGLSDYDHNPSQYNVARQVEDVWTLLDQMGIRRVLVVGTSMGALMAVTMANQAPDRIVGMILNDAGPEIDPRGIARIRGYVGPQEPARSWSEAIERLRSVHGATLPTYTDAEWDRLARSTFVERDVALHLDYDPAIAKAFAAAPMPDLWPAFDIFHQIPGLMIRGALSDLLSPETVRAVGRRYEKVDIAVVPDRGHAPDLTEPVARSAIETFLKRPDLKDRWRTQA